MADLNTSVPAREIKKTSKANRYIFFAAAVLALLAVIGVFGISAYVGWNLTHPKRQQLDNTPAAVGLGYEDVSFKSRGEELRGQTNQGA